MSLYKKCSFVQTVSFSIQTINLILEKFAKHVFWVNEYAREISLKNNLNRPVFGQRP